MKLPMLKVFDFFQSSACYRVRIALNLKNISYDKVPINLYQEGGEQHLPEYLELNPQGLIPSLQFNQQILTQSLAIIEYLNDLYPDPALLPHKPLHKAIVRSLALSIVADIHPLNNIRVLKYLTQEFYIMEEEQKKWVQHWITIGFTALEKQLQDMQCAGNFCFGDAPSLADVCLIPQVYNAKRFACNLKPYPLIQNITQHCEQIDAFKSASPEYQKLETV